MLLDIIVIVLRETLEASVLIAVLLAVSLNHGIKFTWLPVALLIGLVGSVSYGSNLGVISEWFDYAGQEVVNAGLQLGVYVLICILNALQWQDLLKSQALMRSLMIIIVCAALVREGGELYVFYGGFLQKEDVLIRALTSGFIGLALGLSAGSIVFYALATGARLKAKTLHIIVLTLVAAGMVLQATQLLMQVDWISSSEPLWNSNWLIPESSIIGQIIYAVFGYEATPSIVEVSAYSLSIASVFMVSILFSLYCRRYKTISKSV